MVKNRSKVFPAPGRKWRGSKLLLTSLGVCLVFSTLGLDSSYGQRKTKDSDRTNETQVLSRGEKGEFKFKSFNRFIFNKLEEDQNGKIVIMENYQADIPRTVSLGYEYKSFYRVIDESTIQRPEITKEIEKPTYPEIVSPKQPDSTAPLMPPGRLDERLYSSIRGVEQMEFCDRVRRSLPTVSFRLCLHSPLQVTQALSVQNQKIFFTDIYGSLRTATQKRVLLLGGIHGDELTSVSSVFHWMPDIGRIAEQNLDWRIIPLMNPDGFFHETPSRTNANGVDLNRNMPTENWDSLALDYWRKFTRRSERKFPGHSPASEPESIWLMKEIDDYQPDLIITVHAPYNLVDYDAQDRSNAPRRLGILPGKQLGTFPGSLGRYAGEERGIPVITIELPHSSELPELKYVDAILEEMVDWVNRNVT